MKEELLKTVIRQYLSSRDFNGLYLDASQPDLVSAAVDLVKDGMVQVVAEEDYMNPHIRPWPSRRTPEQQIVSLKGLSSDGYGLCLYPMPLALKSQRMPRRFAGQPFRQDMAKGRGTLELAFFSFDVLEQYRNDPRFRFNFYDFGVDIHISDEAYLDEAEPEHDKTGMQHIGFAYDLSNYSRDDPNSPVIRRVCAFYGDLAALTPTHQQRWKTYQVDNAELRPHPVWWAAQMGHWPDGVGPFERLLTEMRWLNELHENAFAQPLFRTTDRPDGFGWILRPSQQEWDQFIHQLDKLLSENIRHDALDLRGVPRSDDKGQNIGTLNRLATLLITHKVPEAAAKKVLKPLREVRQARQRPAHTLRENLTDKTYIHKQITLLEEVAESISLLRRFWQTHPNNKAWKPKYGEPEHLYRM